MNRKNTFKAATVAAMLAMIGTQATAQDIHFTQFEAAPLIVNPAFTGGFNGTARANLIYRNQWQSVTVPFVTYAASVDAPIVHDLSHDDYLAAGLQFYNDRAGDGNLQNTSVLGSVAYHKFLGGGQTDPNTVLSIGLQGGYTSKSVDISRLYFGDQYYVGGFYGPTVEQFGNNRIGFWNVNAGIGFSQRTSERFGYSLGVGANNLTQPKEHFAEKPNKDVGLGMRYTAQAGAIWTVGEWRRLSLRPAVLFQTQATTNELIVGNEFNYRLGSTEFESIATSVFFGVYYRNSDAAMATIGVEHKGFRFGASYDYNTSGLKNASNSQGGFEFSLRYIAPNPLDFARKLIYPCQRF
jgi:type IX secretion system PorP/SprF family membrane protein